MVTWDNQDCFILLKGIVFVSLKRSN